MCTIKSRREIDRLFSAAKKAASPAIVLIAAPTPDGQQPGGRLAFIAGRKIGNAPARNRSKRVMREASRRLGGPWPGWDILLVARPVTGRLKAEQLDRSIGELLARLEVVR